MHKVLKTPSRSPRDIYEDAYSLEAVLEWSPTRVSIVLLFPVLLSLVVGLWLNSADRGDRVGRCILHRDGATRRR